MSKAHKKSKFNSKTVADFEFYSLCKQYSIKLLGRIYSLLLTLRSTDKFTVCSYFLILAYSSYNTRPSYI